MSQNSYDLDQALLDLSGNKAGPFWTIRDAVEGLQIFGGIGSGKTSGSGRYIALKYLSNGFGGLVLTAKHDEKQLWQEYCRLTNRTEDLIVIEPGGDQYFNFLEYESSNVGDRKSLTLNIVDVLKTVIKARQEKSVGKSDDQFWESALDMLLGNTIDLCLIAYGKVTIELLYKIAQSAPRKAFANPNNAPQKEKGQTKGKESPPKRPPTVFDKALSEAMRRTENLIRGWLSTLSPALRQNFKDNAEITKLAAKLIPQVRRMEFVNDFFRYNLKNIGEKTRAIIDFSLIGLLYGLLQEPTYSLFCRHESTCTPEDCLQGKIILINLPVKDYHKVGQDAQIMFKYIWQRAMERRRVAENGRPVFLWADEAQNFLHEHDPDYQATARSSRIATVYISQNLPNYFANMGGGDKSDYKVKSFLGTLATKIFHANADADTNQYASALIGQDFFIESSGSVQVQEEFNVTHGWGQRLEFLVRPNEFQGLKTGGPVNSHKVTAYIHMQGKQLQEGNYQKISFDQLREP